MEDSEIFACLNNAVNSGRNRISDAGRLSKGMYNDVNAFLGGLIERKYA